MTLRVREVLAGQLPDDEAQVVLLAHSPARDFRASDPVGRAYEVSFHGTFEQPYTGDYTIRPASV